MNDKEILINHILNAIEFGQYYHDKLGNCEERIEQAIKEILEAYVVVKIGN